MAAQFFIVKTKEDYQKVVEYDRKCGLLVHSKDRSEIVKVAHIIDDKHYEYFITTLNRLDRSGADYRGKERLQKKREEEKKASEPKKRRYSMVFYETE